MRTCNDLREVDICLDPPVALGGSSYRQFSRGLKISTLTAPLFSRGLPPDHRHASRQSEKQCKLIRDAIVDGAFHEIDDETPLWNWGPNMAKALAIQIATRIVTITRTLAASISISATS